MTSLVTGWLIVSMDLLLDVSAIRLDGGFWVWEGRSIMLDVTHHMFMSVIWVNFLGYLFETPAVVFLSLKAEKKERSVPQQILRTITVGFAGVGIVGIASGVALLLNSVTDEWFACIAFIVLWGYVLTRLIAQVCRGSLTLRGKKDWSLIIFWAAMYGYCLAALGALGILQAVPFYGVFGAILAAGTLTLCVIERTRLVRYVQPS